MGMASRVLARTGPVAVGGDELVLIVPDEDGGFTVVVWCGLVEAPGGGGGGGGGGGTSRVHVGRVPDECGGGGGEAVAAGECWDVVAAERVAVAARAALTVVAVLVRRGAPPGALGGSRVVGVSAHRGGAAAACVLLASVAAPPAGTTLVAVSDGPTLWAVGLSGALAHVCDVGGGERAWRDIGGAVIAACGAPGGGMRSAYAVADAAGCVGRVCARRGLGRTGGSQGRGVA